MDRYIRSEFLGDPLAHAVQFVRRIIGTWDNQVGDLKPNIGLVLKILEGIENRFEVRDR